MALDAKSKPDLSSFNWENPIRLETQLKEEERMIRDSARTFSQDVLQPRVIAAYREETVDPDVFSEMGKMGLLGITIPEEYGGLGAGYP